METMAILLSGVHYDEQLPNYYEEQGLNIIDFRKYVKNIKKYIYDHFSQKYQLDTFISTNVSDKSDELFEIYKPVSYSFVGDSKKDHGKYDKTVDVLKLLFEYMGKNNKRYDMILLTRFDIFFMEPFTDSNIDTNKLNIVSCLESSFPVEEIIDDNFYLLPIQYLKSFYEIIYNNNVLNGRMHFHELKNSFESQMPVHYIKNENVKVCELTFFKLHYFINDIPFIVNKYEFTENVIYTNSSKQSTFVVNGNVCTLHKTVSENTPNCSIGYEILKPGTYELSCMIHADKDIGDFQFIKTNAKWDSSITANQWQPIKVKIETTAEKETVFLDFSNFNDAITIQVKDLSHNETSIIEFFKKTEYYPFLFLFLFLLIIVFVCLIIRMFFSIPTKLRLRWLRIKYK